MKYILQHTGPWTLIPRKVPSEDIDKLIGSGIISGDGDIKIEFKGRISVIPNHRVKEIMAEEYLYANQSEGPEAHFIRGLVFGKKIQEIEHLLSEHDKRNLYNIFPDGNMKFWGSKGGIDGRTERKIKEIDLADRIILISTFGVEAVCEVAYLIKDSRVGEILWNDADYENIIFFKNIHRESNISIDEIKQILKFLPKYDKISMHIVDFGDDGYLRLNYEISKIFGDNL